MKGVLKGQEYRAGQSKQPGPDVLKSQSLDCQGRNGIQTLLVLYSQSKWNGNGNHTYFDEEVGMTDSCSQRVYSKISAEAAFQVLAKCILTLNTQRNVLVPQHEKDLSLSTFKCFQKLWLKCHQIK